MENNVGLCSVLGSYKSHSQFSFGKGLIKDFILKVYYLAKDTVKFSNVIIGRVHISFVTMNSKPRTDLHSPCLRPGSSSDEGAMMTG